MNANKFPANAFAMEGLYAFYKDFKNNTGAYKQFLAANNSSSSGTTGMSIAGMNTNTLLILGGLATAAYFILN